MPIQLNHLEYQREYFSHYHLCNYKPRSVGSDKLSESLLRFKNCYRMDVEAWTECAVKCLLKLSIAKKTTLLRPLGREELKATINSRTALDWMAKKLAKELDITYKPELLYKKRNIRSVKWLSRTERESELFEVYDLNGEEDISEVLVVDDILTTGSTMKEIIRAIRQKFPKSNITTFTLADTDYQALLNVHPNLKGQTYAWEGQHWKHVAEPQSYYAAKEVLKKQIMANNFDQP